MVHYEVKNMPAIVKEVLHQKYMMLELDMSRQRKSESPSLERVYHELVVFDAVADFTLRLNDPFSDAINIRVGESLEIKDFNIRMIFIENDAAGGIQRIWLSSFYE